MANIIIEDLAENIELDSRAMANILGGKSWGKTALASVTRRKFDRFNPVWLARLVTK
jgi:hypothetical protein